MTINAQMLIVYSSVLFVSITSLSLMNYYKVQEILKTRELKNTLSVLEQVRSVVDTNLDLIDKLSYVIFSNDNVIEILKNNPETFGALSVRDQSEVEDLLYDIVYSREDLSAVFLYNNSGESLRTQPDRLNIPFGELSGEADISDGKLVWLNPDEESNSLVAVRKMYDLQIRPIGYLRLDIRKNRWLNLLSRSFTEKKGSILIFNHGRIILKGNPDFPVTPGMSFAALSETWLEKDGNIIVSLDSQKNEWQYTGIIPLSEVYRDTITIRTFMLFNTLLAVAVFSIISLVVTRRLTKPLHEIADQMKSIYLKDWTPQVRYSGNNEITYLADQFNEMGVRLNLMADELVEQESLQVKQQLETLQAQINPHFLYNTLDIVSWMAIRHKLPDISKIVSSLSEMMRYSISSASSTVLKDEISHIKNYLAIQELRFTRKFRFELHLDDSLMDTPVPKLILQPLVENSIIHGFKGRKEGGLLCLSSERTGRTMVLRIEDNGVGIPRETIPSLLEDSDSAGGEGIGVRNVHRRLVLTYGPSFGLGIDSLMGHHTTVTIRIPLEDSGHGSP